MAEQPPKLFENVSQKLAMISADLRDCRDPQRRKGLLAEMRRYLSEAETLAHQKPTLPKS